MPDENTTPRVGHRSRASPKAREEQFPDTKEKNGLLFCKACNCLLDHMRKKSIDAHLASARHLAKKKAKDEGKELANDIQPEYLNTVWSEEVLRCQTCKRALDHTWKPSVTRHLTACKRKAEHEDDWKPERKKTSSLPSTQLPSTSSQSICPFPKASRSSVTERPTQSLDLSETEKRRDAKFVDDNRAELIQNVTTVMPILDDLLKWGMIHSEAYSNIRAARTSQEQMRELYITLKSDKVKSTFYRILQEKEHNLIQELGGPVCMEVDCYGQTMCIGQSSECLPQAQQNRQTVKRHVADYVSIAIQKHKAELREKYKHVSEGIGKERDSEVFNKIFTELYIITGESERLNSEHEVSQLEDTSQLKADKINCNDIFKPLLGKEKGEKRSIRTVLMKGIAGIGKTFSVQKFILDWAEGKANQHIHFIFVLPFRELNLIRRPHSVHSLLSSFHPGLKELDSPTYKVMIIFDGLDESRFKLDFKNNETLFKITDEQMVNVLLTNIIKRKLLPEALLWITSRPAAANQIPWEYIDQVTVVRGFTDEQKEEYFKKKVGDEKLATRIISHVKMSRSLHLMCQIPIFCWIAAMILGKMLSKNSRGVPKTLTAMYTHFLVTLTDLKGQTNHTNPQKVLKQNRLLILKLGRLAFNHLGESQMFNENDLADCGITDEEREGSLYSAMFTEIFKKEDVFYGELVYYFVHLTIQEFFASLFVFHCFISNEMKDLESFIDVKFRGQPKVHTFLERVVNKASKSENGHLDLFVRFLHGFLLESNQQLLEGLLTRSKDAEETSKSVEEIRKYLKYMATQDISPERCINLFHCLIEMGDRSLNKDIQAYLSHKAMKKSSVELTPDHCSALASVLLKSGEEVDVFDLKKYKASWEKRRRLVPAVTCCRKALLAGCRLTNETCETVAVALRSANSPLRELDLSHNDLQDSGVKQLSDGLKDPHCQLEILRLSGCHVTHGGCASLASALGSNPSHLRELDLSSNHAGDSGVKLLSARLEDPHCRLEKLKLAGCRLTNETCETVAVALRSANSPLRELDLSHNDLQDSGVKQLSDGLKDPHCQLEILRLSGCHVTHGGCASLASALGSNPSHLRELDLSFNHPGDSGVKLLSARLEDPHCRLEKLNVDHNEEFWVKPQLMKKYACDLTLDPNTAHRNLSLSEGNRRVERVKEEQPYPDHPERFDHYTQVLCREGLTGRCYWEVECSGRVVISVTYKSISRKGRSFACGLRVNDKSWCLEYSGDRYTACHNREVTHIPALPVNPPQPQRDLSSSPPFPRVGVFLDWPAGTLSFYMVYSGTMTHLHTFQTTFTEPLDSGFEVWNEGSSVSLSQVE
ncbi:NACHT, LRR and PYD domains-containing protein 12-like isoform X2 [Oncorhynchus mykiss]|uniref:B30.2/SPRY domain-containing protein n=1 Tax=Oncorhynchus mykiss TaxID=8022 RepID=A0A8C7V1F9_ONCMY|nr:NACHT, LRR and PYD domains-containing protein 12-like isoform X2 [Oncorhynchus mykiss]